MERSFEGFSYAGTEVIRCQRNRNDRVLTPAVPILLTDSTVRNTGYRNGESMTSMNAHRMCIKNTDAHGNASAIGITQLTLTVSGAIPKEG